MEEMLMVKKTTYLIMATALVILTGQAWALEDDFDDAVVDASKWVIVDDPCEFGTVIACDVNDSITSHDDFLYENLRFILRDVYDTRPPYDHYTLGYTGYIEVGGYQYILLRNDNAGGGVLNVEVAVGYLQTKVLGNINIGDSSTHDIEARFYWSPSALVVELSDMAKAGVQVVLTETDPNWIPDANMAFKHQCSQVSAGETYDLDYVGTGTIAELDVNDHFDDGVIGSEWAVGGSPVESGTLLSGVNGDSITSEGYMKEGEISFGLRNIYDSRNMADYTKYTLGYAGLSAGNPYLLVRNDNQPGGVLAVQIHKLGNPGTPKTLGTINVSGQVTHDIDVYMKWTDTEVRVELDDLATPGIDVILTETDPNWIPAKGMSFINQVSQVLNGTWDLDFVRTGPKQFSIPEDEFDDNFLDPNLWNKTGDPCEFGTIVAAEAAERIFSKGYMFHGDVRFRLVDVYDTRPPYDRYTLGYAGLTAGSQYVLVRNENQPGGSLAAQVYIAPNVKTLGSINIGGSQEHDVDAYISWTDSELTVTLHNLTTGAFGQFVETDPNWIPNIPMQFVHQGSQLAGGTWNIDFVRPEPLQMLGFEDDFDDESIDPNLWIVVGDPCEHGTLISGTNGDRISSKMPVSFDTVQFGLRNLYDSRGGPYTDYTTYTLGYTGLGTAKYILIRNDNAGGNYLNLQAFISGVWTTLDSLFLGDGQFHDVDVVINWEPNYMRVTMDDLATGGIDTTYETNDVNIIPQQPLSFVNSTSQVKNATWDLDYVLVGPACGEWGYFDVDLNHDCEVDSIDLGMFVDEDGWLNCNNMQDGNCPPFVPRDDSLSGITTYTAVPGTAVIDGNLADWATNAPWTPMQKLYDGTVVDANNAWFACRYDDVNDLIYCAVRVTDTDQWFNMTYMGWDQQDDIEIYIKGDVNATGSPWPPVDWAIGQQFIVGYDSFGGNWAIWPDTQLVNTETPAVGLTTAVAVSGNEIIYEFSATPWDNYTGKGGDGNDVRTDLYAGKVIGFDVVIAVKATSDFGMLCANTDKSKAYDVGLYANLVCTDGRWANYIPADFDTDFYVDFQDFDKLAQKWLMCTDPKDSECVHP